MDGNASFGYWIRRRRKALDLTQAELARRIGCAETTLRKIEADVRRPSRQIAERLAECLAIPPADRARFVKAARSELAVLRRALSTGSGNSATRRSVAISRSPVMMSSRASFSSPRARAPSAPRARSSLAPATGAEVEGTSPSVSTCGGTDRF